MLKQTAHHSYVASCRKVELPEMRDNDTKTIKVCVDGNEFCPRKEWGYMPGSLGSRSISVGRQSKIFVIQQLQCGDF